MTLVSSIAAFGTDDREQAMRWRRKQARRLGVTTEVITTALREHRWTIHEIENMCPEDAHQLSQGVHAVKYQFGAPIGECTFEDW